MMARSIPIQIAAGIDFGTAFTKAMIRNTNTDELIAVGFPHDGSKTYFLPSVLFLKDGHLVHPIGTKPSEMAATVPYLKMALAEKCRAAPERWGTLLSQSNGAELPYSLDEYIEALAGLFLVDVIRHCHEAVRSQWTDFGTHSEDKIFYQMSIPAEDAQQEETLDRFKKCLYWAVSKAESGEQESSLGEIQSAIESHHEREDCFFLAEVTANVLTYRLSRSGRPGLYLFVDVGAGTVDLSVFFYPDPERVGEQQNYAAARVSFTGSSQIELRAMGHEGSPKLLAELRWCKEGHPSYSQHTDRIEDSKRSLVEELELAIRKTLGEAQPRFVPNQFGTLEVLTGGGGWCDVPYLEAVNNAVQGFWLNPQPYPLPQPEDAGAIWGDEAAQLAPRFSVAHGLSHPFWNWPLERYPHQMGILERQPLSERPINPAHEDDG